MSKTNTRSSAEQAVTDSVYLSNCGRTCEMSANGFGRILAYLRLNGISISASLAEARTVLINACCVIPGKRENVAGMLQAALENGHVQTVIVFGCFAGIDRVESERVVYVPSRDIEQLDNYFDHTVPIARAQVGTYHPSFFRPYQRSHDPSAQYVLIAHGCQNHCSYCNIKFAKGATKSRPIQEIQQEIDHHLRSGHFLFVLLADDCGSYGTDIGTSIADLMGAILAQDPRISLRLHYLFPLTLIQYRDRFADLVATGRITYLNAPIQSGSQRVLELMNRRYDIETVLDTVEQFRALSPATWFYTHAIINFPTETEADFEATLKAVDSFDEILLMDYFRNPMTAASRLPEVDRGDRSRRLDRAQAFLARGEKGLLIGDETGALPEGEPTPV